MYKLFSDLGTREKPKRPGGSGGVELRYSDGRPLEHDFRHFHYITWPVVQGPPGVPVYGSSGDPARSFVIPASLHGEGEIRFVCIIDPTTPGQTILEAIGYWSSSGAQPIPEPVPEPVPTPAPQPIPEPPPAPDPIPGTSDPVKSAQAALIETEAALALARKSIEDARAAVERAQLFLRMRH